MFEDVNRNIGPSLNPAALTPADAARMLSRASGQAISFEMLQTDIAAGAPINADDTINLMHYTAWLVKEMGHGD